jgi:mediator of RNA polymerase II transcription subunit 24
MKILNEDEVAKPRFMIQQLMKPVDENTMKQETFKERLAPTHDIIHKLCDVRSSMDIVQKNASQKPLNALFCEQWKEIVNKSYMPFDIASNLEALLKSCGPYWLMNNLMEQMYQCKFIHDMEFTMDIVFAIMHLNIEACTEALLKEILPILLLNKDQ